MKEYNQLFRDYFELVNDLLNSSELDEVNTGFIGALLTTMAQSKDDNVPIYTIVQDYKLAVNYVLNKKFDLL